MEEQTDSVWLRVKEPKRKVAPDQRGFGQKMKALGLLKQLIGGNKGHCCTPSTNYARLKN